MPAQTPEEAHYHLEEGHLCVDFINTAYIQVDEHAPYGYEPSEDKLTDLPALAEWADFPTLPQVWVKGELIGGSDIAAEMVESGELQQMLDA